jgi:hypothetical protein
MSYTENIGRIHDLVSELRDQFDFSEYKITYDSKDIVEPGIRVSISDCRFAEEYESQLQITGDVLNDLLSFVDTSTMTRKNELIIYAINILDIFDKPEILKESNLTFKLTVEDEQLIENKILLFEEVKKEMHIQILKGLRLLLKNEPGLKSPKLKWVGEQKQLAELFANLILNGFIEIALNGSTSNIVSEVLNNAFDLTHSTRNGQGNKKSNLKRYLNYDPRSEYKFPDCMDENGIFFKVGKAK